MRNSNVAIHAPQLNALQEQAIDNFFNGIEQILDFGEALRPKERRDIVKLVRQNLIFVREAMEAIDEVPELLPSYLDEQVIKDRFELHEQLRMLEDKTGAFMEKVRDLRFVLGRQSFEDGLSIYRAAKLGSINRVPKASYYYNRMRRRFLANGTPNSENSDDANNPDQTTGDQNTPLANDPPTNVVVENANDDPNMGNDVG